VDLPLDAGCARGVEVPHGQALELLPVARLAVGNADDAHADPRFGVEHEDAPVLSAVRGDVQQPGLLREGASLDAVDLDRVSPFVIEVQQARVPQLEFPVLDLVAVQEQPELLSELDV
jgi:hypothetical protein